MSLPPRKATSRHKSFSIKPVGPMVPVSCPPCPASMTMRPIFRPRARDKDCWPSRVGSGMEGGPISSAWSWADLMLRTDLVFEEAGRAASGGASGLLPAPVGGKVVDSPFVTACAIWSFGDGGAAGLDTGFLSALFEVVSGRGWVIGEADGVVTFPFWATSMFSPAATAVFDRVLSGALAAVLDEDSAAGFSGFTGGGSFVGPGAGALAR